MFCSRDDVVLLPVDGDGQIDLAALAAFDEQ